AGSAMVDTPILTRSRHIHGIRQARLEVSEFGKAWQEGELPAPVAAVHLRAATVALESLIGAVSTEDVLDRVFSSFCVGKCGFSVSVGFARNCGDLTSACTNSPVSTLGAHCLLDHACADEVSAAIRHDIIAN